MKLIDIIEKIIMDYPVGEPVFNKDLAKAVCEITGLPLSKASVYIAIAIRRLIGKGIKLKRFKKGVYYRYEDCLFGETFINSAKLINKKYIKENSGYEIGPAVLNTMGFTTLMSNSPRVFVSNAAMRRSFTDKKLNVRILKPKTMLNEDNIHYFQFLDILKLVGETPIDNKHPEFIFKRFVESYDLKLDLLILCAYRFYEKDVLEAVLHFVEKLKGSYLGISV